MAEMDQREVERRLWKAVEDDKVGMLGVVGGRPHHFQPMTAYFEEESRTLWFYSYKDAELLKEIGEGHAGMFTFVDKDRKVWACLGGELKRQDDPARIQKFWNATVAAWYPDGKDDPRLTLLRFSPSEAEVWVNDKGPLRFGLELLKGALPGRTADGGAREHLDLG